MISPQVSFPTYGWVMVDHWLRRCSLLKCVLIGMLTYSTCLDVLAQPLQQVRPKSSDASKTQHQTPATSLSGGCLAITQVERDAKVAMLTGERNRARTLTEQALKAQPQPILGAYVLAQVYEEAEGNFPKALYWIRESTKWLTQACGVRPIEEEAVQLHRELLIREAFILGDMDLRSEQLESLGRYDDIYQPPKDELKIWPLVKLGRFAEAREIGMRLVQSEDQFVRSRAFNGMMAVECEARNRKASYDWGMRGHIDAKEQSCVIALNMGLASRQCFKFDEEERFNRIALRAEDRDCSSSPYIQSSATYLIRGEWQKSISALSSWAPSTPMEWMQSHMRVKARRAELMYGLGVWRRGLKEIHEVVTYPDRAAGTDSASGEMLNLEAYVLYWALLDGERIAGAERRAVRGVWGWMKGQPKRFSHAWRQWRVKRQVVRYAAYQQNFVDLIRPYFSSVMPWYSVVVPHIVGAGVLRAAIDHVRETEQDFPDQAGAYLDGLEAELAWIEGDAEQTLKRVDQALINVPHAAKLFRYRLRALRWAAQAKVKGIQALDDDLHILLSQYPVPLRSLDLSIPVDIRYAGGEVAERAARFIERSPRFTLQRDGTGLILSITETANDLQLCLQGPRGNRYRCVDTSLDLAVELERRKQKRRAKRGQPIDVDKQSDPSTEKEEKEEVQLDPDAALRLIDRVHQELFSPQVELTQREMDTLDGNIRQLKADDALDALDY